MKKLIVHVSCVEITEESGMGRIEWHWRNAFVKKGYEFFHIGPKEVGKVYHSTLFPYAALKAYKKLKLRPSLFLIHEPVSGLFVSDGIPTVVESHGIERRIWKLKLKYNWSGMRIWKMLWTSLIFPLYRLKISDHGLQKADMLLIANEEDYNFVRNYYGREPADIYLYKNGVYPSKLNELNQPHNETRVLFVGSWLERKGIRTLISAAEILFDKGMRLKYLVAGTGLDVKNVLDFWPERIRPFVEVIPYFKREDEENLYRKSNIFVLPSWYEGQPLALLQAMETGRCCITTDCCGQKDLITHDYNGLLFPPGDAQRLASLIEECVSGTDKRLRLGKNAKLSVKDRTWYVVADELVDKIDEMLNKLKY